MIIPKINDEEAKAICLIANRINHSKDDPDYDDYDYQRFEMPSLDPTLIKDWPFDTDKYEDPKYLPAPYAEKVNVYLKILFDAFIAAINQGLVSDKEFDGTRYFNFDTKLFLNSSQRKQLKDASDWIKYSYAQEYYVNNYEEPEPFGDAYQGIDPSL